MQLKTAQPTRTFLIFLATACLAGCDAGSPADKFAGSPADMQRAKSIFTGTCGGYCHSTTPGPRDAPYLFDCTWRHGGSDQEIFTTISSGVPETRMVSFGGMLPEGDNDIWRLVAFIRSGQQAC